MVTPRLSGSQIFDGAAAQTAVQRMADASGRAPCGHCGEVVLLEDALMLFIYGKVMAVICPKCVHGYIGLRVQRDRTTVKVVYTRPSERLILPVKDMPEGLRPINERTPG